jgi:tRNA A-37 threonylcarbamoyl transferase component Bud32
VESFLDVDSAVAFLTEREILRPNMIFGGGVVIEAVPRRNRNLLVSLSDGSGFFVKQPEETSAHSSATLRIEGEFYRRHSTGPLAGILPHLVRYEAESPIIVLEMLEGYQDLTLHCLARPADEFPIHLWRRLGELLGGLHRDLGHDDSAVRGWLKDGLRLHRPSPSVFASISPGGLEVLEILQSSAVIGDGLDEAHDGWRSDGVIHGDLRGDNILVATTAAGGADLRLIDWETCQRGDTAWDLAGILALGTALTLHGAFPPSDVEGQPPAGLPMATFQSCNRAFWQGYGGVRGLPETESPALARDAARYTAARLVLTAVEMSARRDAPPAAAVDLLQLSENIFADPGRAATDFFAIA